MKASTFIASARSLIGLTYEQCDCIGVVRKAAGIRCQGTNWLWRSINNSPAYQYLTARTTDMKSVLFHPGALVFKIKQTAVPIGYSDTPDCHHVGILTRMPDGQLGVIHSSPSTGVREELFVYTAWDGYGALKQIELDPDDFSSTDVTAPSVTTTYAPTDAPNNEQINYGDIIARLAALADELRSIAKELGLITEGGETND